MKKIYFALCMVLVVSLTACRDSEFDNPVNGGENEAPQEISITDYDDLDYFQNAIIAVDSAGTMLCRNYGEVLYANEPDHLYIGVKDLTEAETIFRRWIAPDVALSTTIPTTNGLTCPLTDANGKPQGTSPSCSTPHGPCKHPSTANTPRATSSSIHPTSKRISVFPVI